MEGIGAKDRRGDEGRERGDGARRCQVEVASGRPAAGCRCRSRSSGCGSWTSWSLNNPFYNIPGGVRLEGSWILRRWSECVNEIVRRHEALRTRFEVEEGEPVQVIDEWEPRRLEVEDLTRLDPGREREEARQEDSERGGGDGIRSEPRAAAESEGA